MKTKDYMKPTMQVVKVQQTGMLMESTEVTTASRSSYGTASEDEWN